MARCTLSRVCSWMTPSAPSSLKVARGHAIRSHASTPTISVWPSLASASRRGVPLESIAIKQALDGAEQKKTASSSRTRAQNSTMGGTWGMRHTCRLEIFYQTATNTKVGAVAIGRLAWSPTKSSFQKISSQASTYSVGGWIVKKRRKSGTVALTSTLWPVINQL